MKAKAPPRYYLDWASTAIPDHKSEDRTVFANPSSLHEEGRLAKEVLENSRDRCAKVLGVKPENLYFTSGGTESNALVLHSCLLRREKGRVLYSAVEHPSVRENCLKLGKLGIKIGVIGVENDGRVSEETLSKALKKNPDTRLIAIMAVNNETGSLMNIKDMVSHVRQNQSVSVPPIHFHSDLVQAVGKVPVNINSCNLDSASISAHKLGGPRGIGLLYLKKNMESLFAGGKQEGGIRPGTENVHGALALADLLERRANPKFLAKEEKEAAMRLNYLINNLKKIKRCTLIPEDRQEDDIRFSPWILQLKFRDIPGAVMVRALDDLGFAVSTGSSCSSTSPDRPVLAAMGLNESSRLEGIRISQGFTTKTSDFEAFLSGLERVLSFL